MKKKLLHFKNHFIRHTHIIFTVKFNNLLDIISLFLNISIIYCRRWFIYIYIFLLFFVYIFEKAPNKTIYLLKI